MTDGVWVALIALGGVVFSTLWTARATRLAEDKRARSTIEAEDVRAKAAIAAEDRRHANGLAAERSNRYAVQRSEVYVRLAAAVVAMEEGSTAFDLRVQLWSPGPSIPDQDELDLLIQRVVAGVEACLALRGDVAMFASEHVRTSYSELVETAVALLAVGNQLVRSMQGEDIAGMRERRQAVADRATALVSVLDSVRTSMRRELEQGDEGP